MKYLPPYPETKPYKTFMLKVSGLHTLWVEECGNPEGTPVVFLHGGPGAGCEAFHRRFFDPKHYRIILFDQRGCGRSTPHAELRENTTQDLVTDIERIREHLGIDRWLVFGGSWGATLGLAYAEAYPDRVTGLILRGIFLCRRQDIQWFYQEGAGKIHPELWEEYVRIIPEDERHDMVGAYYRRLTSSDVNVQLAAARAWSVWEGATSNLVTKPSVLDHFAHEPTALSLARIECHYFIHDSFLHDNQLLKEAHRLEGIPGVIVHGRYDMVCPIEQAWALHQAWPGSELKVAPCSGHSATEPEIIDALVLATQQFREMVT